MIKAKGNKPINKNRIPEVIMLYVNPLNIFNSICPAKILAPNLNPKDTLRDKYEINSIITNKGNKDKGQPAGTNNEKNLILCFFNPNIVAPNTIEKN